MRLNRLASVALAGSVAAAGLTVAPVQTASATTPLWADITDVTITSNPADYYDADADGVAGTAADVAAFQARFPEAGEIQIDATIYKPHAADTADVPMVIHSHGWGGAKTKGVDAFTTYAEAGYGVISFTQRGFGATGGKAHLENIDVEGRDVQRVIDEVARLGWVAEETPGDPVVVAIGGSYGGGYQLAGAFAEARDGNQRMDALAPEITWNSLGGSLAPSETVRTTWVVALYAAGANAHTQLVHEAFAYGAATGEWPKGQGLAPGVSARDLAGFLEDASPTTHVAKGTQLDIPVLIGQGTTDNLFNLNQGLDNFAEITSAKSDSLFIGYNGGHVLPEAFPLSTGPSGDPCSAQLTGGGSFGDLALEFFDHHLGRHAASQAVTDALGEYRIAADADTCIATDTVTDYTTRTADVAVAFSGLGAPQHVALMTNDGTEPIEIAGAAQLSARATTGGLDNRLFAGLSIGTTPADAQVIQANVLPIRWTGKHLAGAETTQTIAGELPGIGAVLQPGQTLFVTLSPNATMFGGHNSRTASPVVLTDLVVDLPIV